MTIAAPEPLLSSRRSELPKLPVQRRAVATAPMRVSFAGGGTDLPPFFAGLGGRVIGTAVELRVRAEVEPFDPGWVRLEVSESEGVYTRRASEPPRREIAFRLLEAALAEAGVDGGVRIRVETDVVPGAGLGGSAAAAVAALAAIHGAKGELPAREELARAALRLEREGLHLACGSQDPMFAACGGVLDLRFDDRGAVTRSAPAVDRALLAALGAGMLLVDTGVRRVSGDVVSRTPRVAEVHAELVAAAGDVARGLACGSLEDVLQGMRRNAAAKLRRDPAGSAAAVGIAGCLADHGAEVVRVCGAGEGGHVLVWADPSRHEAIRRVLKFAVRRPALAAEGVRMEEGD